MSLLCRRKGLFQNFHLSSSSIFFLLPGIDKLKLKEESDWPFFQQHRQAEPHDGNCAYLQEIATTNRMVFKTASHRIVLLVERVGFNDW